MNVIKVLILLLIININIFANDYHISYTTVCPFILDDEEKSKTKLRLQKGILRRLDNASYTAAIQLSLTNNQISKTTLYLNSGVSLVCPDNIRDKDRYDFLTNYYGNNESNDLAKLAEINELKNSTYIIDSEITIEEKEIIISATLNRVAIVDRKYEVIDYPEDITVQYSGKINSFVRNNKKTIEKLYKDLILKMIERDQIGNNKNQ